eukprot:scaffold132907_cov54-Phaeocystis_antarctica.AAC.1
MADMRLRQRKFREPLRHRLKRAALAAEVVREASVSAEIGRERRRSAEISGGASQRPRSAEMHRQAG